MFPPATGSISLKVASNLMASVCARLRAVIIPAGDKLLGILRRPEAGLQFGGSIVVEAKVGSREALFQNCHAGEQAHRSSFHFVGRGQQHFSIALKKCAGNSAHHILREGDGAIFQSDVDGGSIERRVAHPEDAAGIKPDAAQLQIEGFRRPGLRASVPTVALEFDAVRARAEMPSASIRQHRCRICNASVLWSRRWVRLTVARMRFNAASCHYSRNAIDAGCSPAAAASADTIHLKNGRTILADHVRENGNRYEYDIGDDSYAIPKSSVERVEAGGMPALSIVSREQERRAIFPFSSRLTVWPMKATFPRQLLRMARLTPMRLRNLKAKEMPS